MQLWLAMAQSPAERERIEHHLTNQHVDGVLLLSLHDADPLPILLEERGLPTVLGGRPARMLQPGAQPAYFVDVDNAGGARQAVEYLFGRGRRLVATIAGPQDMGVGVARLGRLPGGGPGHRYRRRRGPCRVRRLQREQRRGGDASSCWSSAPIWTRSSSPPT